MESLENKVIRLEIELTEATKALKEIQRVIGIDEAANAAPEFVARCQQLQTKRTLLERIIDLESR